MAERVPDGPLRSSPTATTSATQPASTPIDAARCSTTTRSSCRSATTSTGRATSGRTSTAARDAGREPGVLHAATRCSGRPATSRRSTAPTPPTGRWSPTRRRIANAKIDPDLDLDRHLARPAVQPARRRRAARERAHRHHLQVNRRANDAITVPAARARTALWRNTSMATLAPAGTVTLAPSIARLRVGRGPRQRLPASRADRPVDDHARREPDAASTTAAPSTRARPPTPDAVPRRRAARSCSAPAPSSGRGVSTQPRHRPAGVAAAQPTPARTCSRRRSTSSPTWARSRPRWLGPGGGHQVDRHHCRPTRPSPRPRPAPRSPTARGHRHGHRDRRRRRRGGRRRGLDRRRHDLASGHRHHLVDLHRLAERQRAEPIKARAIDDSGNIADARRPRSTCRCRARARSSARPPTRLVRAPRTRPRRRRSGDRAGRQFRTDPTASSPASGSTRAPATPAPTPAACGPRRASCWPRHLHQRAATGWQQADFATPWRSPPTRPTWCPTTRRRALRRRAGPTSTCPGAPRGRSAPWPTAADGPNGVYTYGGDAFPTATFNATNYWVDALFTRLAVDTTPPTVTATDAGATAVERRHVGGADGDVLRAGAAGHGRRSR